MKFSPFYPCRAFNDHQGLQESGDLSSTTSEDSYASLSDTTDAESDADDGELQTSKRPKINATAAGDEESSGYSGSDSDSA